MRHSPLTAVNIIRELIGDEKLLNALVRSLSWDVLEDHLAYIIRTLDLLDPYNLTDDDYEILDSMKERDNENN